MAILKINKDIIPSYMDITDVCTYVEKRLNRLYCFDDIIKYDNYSSNCSDEDFLEYLDLKGSLVSSYVSSSDSNYLEGVFLRCDCSEEDVCNCTYDVKKINYYIFSNLSKFFDVSQMKDMETGLSTYLALNRCSVGLFNMELECNDQFSNYIKVKQKLVDKFLGIEEKHNEG